MKLLQSLVFYVKSGDETWKNDDDGDRLPDMLVCLLGYSFHGVYHAVKMPKIPQKV